MNKNIVLIGMSGCGKTTIGQMLAKKLSYDFVDTDEVIESFGMTIAELFESGEKSFRYVETMAAKQVSGYHNTVISTGGGIVTVVENMEYLKKNSVVVFVQRDIMRIKTTLEKEANTRPLLKDDKSLENLYSKRLHLYEKYSDFTVENNGSVYKVCDEIINKFKETAQ